MKKRMYVLFAVIVLVFVIGLLALDKYNLIGTRNEAPTIDTSEYFISDFNSQVSEIDSLLYEEQISKVKYHIIVGSFKNVENAKKFQYIYPDCKILPIDDNGFHKVSILEYDNLDECIRKLKLFRVNNEDSWIYKEEYNEKEQNN